jgi:hypothetical protein
VGNPPTGTFAELGISNPLRPPSGLSRNQLQLLYNTPFQLKKQRVQGVQACRFIILSGKQALFLLTVICLRLV